MKKLSLFAFAFAAALVMTGCSDENGALSETGTSTSTTGEGYMSVAINLPTTTGTRAVDSYVDGSDEEYEVKSGKLLLFGGDDEASATCQGVYDLDVRNFQEDKDNVQVTSKETITQKVESIEGTKFYMLVVLNDNGLITDNMKGEKLSALTTTAQTLSESDLRGTGFFMANAPIQNDNPGGSQTTAPTAKATTLVEFSADKIHSTAAAAQADPAGSVYVERALSKVTLTDDSGSSTSTNTNITSYKITGWTLDNTNKKTYLVRNIDEFSTWASYASAYKSGFYRFIENDPIVSGETIYRINFAKDPNYAADAGTELTKLSAIPSVLTSVGDDYPMYCLENTFDVNRMTWKNTTSAIVAAELKVNNADSDGSFYIINDNTSDILDETGACAYVASLWATYLNTTSGTGKVITDYVTQGTIGSITAELETLSDGGYPTVKSVSFDQTGVTTYAGDYDYDKVCSAAVSYLNDLISNGDLTIAYYKGGVSYYSVRIKHFGDEDTPWKEDYASASTSYPDGTNSTAENDWLGRYGMVRNTWYSLSVTGVNDIGYPTVPDIDTDTQDDEVKKYIAVTINILSWARRSQTATLE